MKTIKYPYFSRKKSTKHCLVLTNYILSCTPLRKTTSKRYFGS